jgi:hypothetical protein
MSRLDAALEVLPAPTRAAVGQTMTETPRSRPPQPSLANDRIQKI